MASEPTASDGTVRAIAHCLKCSRQLGKAVSGTDADRNELAANSAIALLSIMS